jgi:hypothetical protein
MRLGPGLGRLDPWSGAGRITWWTTQRRSGSPSEAGWSWRGSEGWCWRACRGSPSGVPAWCSAVRCSPGVWQRGEHGEHGPCMRPTRGPPPRWPHPERSPAGRDNDPDCSHQWQRSVSLAASTQRNEAANVRGGLTSPSGSRRVSLPAGPTPPVPQTLRSHSMQPEGSASCVPLGTGRVRPPGRELGATRNGRP